MYSVDNISANETDIKIIKGDTFRERIRIINDADLCYLPEPGDQIIFSVLNKYTDEVPLFEKRIPYDNLILQLSAKETSRMKFGNYVYKIRLIRRNGDCDVFIHGKFIITGML